MKARRLLIAAVLMLAAGAAAAQSFRCTGKDGRKYYGSTIPPQCVGLPVEQLSKQGLVIKRFDAPQASEEERLAKEAEVQKKREEDAALREERRRNNALLATYTSVRDIDDARARALAENDKAIREVEARITEIKKRQAGYDKEMEFYSDAGKSGEKSAKAKSGGPAPRAAAKPPAKLLEDVKNAEIDMNAQMNLLAAKKKDVEVISSKYDEDKKRYLELTGKPVKR